MSDGWTATVRVARRDPTAGARLVRALLPESAREVPRARATVDREPDGAVVLTVAARDTGALRAALQTYLGWVELADATESAVAGPR